MNYPDRNNPEWERELVESQAATSLKRRPPTKLHRESDLAPVWVTLKESYELSGIPKSSFDKRRKEGYFKVYLTPGCHSIRLKYDEVLADSENFYAGGKPRHEPSEFLPRRGSDV